MINLSGSDQTMRAGSKESFTHFQCEGIIPTPPISGNHPHTSSMRESCWDLHWAIINPTPPIWGNHLVSLVSQSTPHLQYEGIISRSSMSGYHPHNWGERESSPHLYWKGIIFLPPVRGSHPQTFCERKSFPNNTQSNFSSHSKMFLTHNKFQGDQMFRSLSDINFTLYN